jgi:predicted Zn-ribbon and HTH transcriptional regulator
MTANLQSFRCMMCGYEYQEVVEKGEDKERTCAKCRSNSIRHLKAQRPSVKGKKRAQSKA